MRGLLALLFISLALAPEALAATEVVVSGSTTIMPFGAAAAKAFNAQQSEYHVSVSGGDTDAGIANVTEGHSDIAMISGELSPTEKSKYGDRLKEYLVAYDGICMVVSNQIYNSGVKGLTRAQVRQIYAGNISNWKEVGGPDRAIFVIAREHGSGTRSTFNEDIMGDRYAETPGVDEHGRIEKGNSGVKAVILGSNRAIGYLGYYYLGQGLPAVSPHGILISNPDLQAISLDEVLPTLDTIKAGKYPMARKLYMATYGDAKPGAKAFLDFVASPTGQSIAKKNGFIPEGPTTGQASAANEPGQAAVSADRTPAAPESKAQAPAQAKPQPGFEAILATVGLLAGYRKYAASVPTRQKNFGALQLGCHQRSRRRLADAPSLQPSSRPNVDDWTALKG
ncbi:PBP superfamily domain protein [uncultured archaeon]|nr:PBP superfamily domain protein [uncultured archaeon]